MQCFAAGNLTPDCLENILQTIAEGLFLVDHEGIIRYCNRALETMTGLNSNELIGRKCCSVMKDKCLPPPSCTLFSEGQVCDSECAIENKSGKTVIVLKNARVLKDPDGNVLGAVETLTDITALRSTLDKLNVLEKRFSRIEGFGSLVGKSNAMKQVYNLIELAAASNATVLINGETGTGKELVAHEIHDTSSRKGAPLVKINCSALPETLLESELFGHARGSFTGAVKDKEGRFELAEGGTLFIDEIGEISPLIQVKLLRFLQEKEFERVGENITRKADVRIIAATHRDLRRMIQEGRFREDLFYRLKVFPIQIPPLRDRKEDIGALVQHFIGKFKAETGKPIEGLTHDSAVTLMDYCWPGNIRELENAIEHAFVTCRENLIGMFDLPLEIRRVELRKGICSTDEKVNGRAFLSQPQTPTISDEDFRRILQECNGNQSEAARRLGVDRTTVWRRVKRLMI
jgi:two-component system, NtrC family, response regulator HydG